MRRVQFLRRSMAQLALLAGCGEGVQIGGGSPPPPIVKRLIWVIGDSIASGRADGLININPGVMEGMKTGDTVFNSITGQSFSNSGGFGDICKPLAEELFALNGGVPTYFVNSGLGGSTAYPVGGNPTWYTSDTVYANAKALCDLGCSQLGKSGPDDVLIILGVNDVRQGVTPANFLTGAQSLIDRIEADYPGAQISVINIGRAPGVDTSNANFYGGRKVWIDLTNAAVSRRMVQSNDNYYNFVDNVYYDIDEIHLDNGGYRRHAQSIAANWYDTTTSDKWARYIKHCCLGMDSGQHLLVDAFIAACGGYNGSAWQAVNGLWNMRAFDNLDLNVDWTGLGHTAGLGYTIASNDYVEFAGNINSRFATSCVPSVMNRGGIGQDNMAIGGYVALNSQPGGTQAVPFGLSDSTRSFRVIQNTTLVQCTANDATALSFSETVLQSGVWYAAGRYAASGANAKRAMKDGVNIAVATTASNGNSLRYFSVGVNNFNDSPIFPWSGRLHGFIVCAADQYQTVRAGFETLRAAW